MKYTIGLSIHPTSPLTILNITVMPAYCVDYISLGGIHSDSLRHPYRILINSLSDIYERGAHGVVCVQISFDRLLLLVHPQIRFYFYITAPFLSPYHVYIVNILRIHFARKLYCVLFIQTIYVDEDSLRRTRHKTEILLYLCIFDTHIHFVSPIQNKNV